LPAPWRAATRRISLQCSLMREPALTHP
jgi:hypothetical protein